MQANRNSATPAFECKCLLFIKMISVMENSVKQCFTKKCIITFENYTNRSLVKEMREIFPSIKKYIKFFMCLLVQVKSINQFNLTVIVLFSHKRRIA